MDYQKLMVSVRQQVLTDLNGSFNPQLLETLTISLNEAGRSSIASDDQYRSRRKAIPAYYNPNSHTIHLNVPVLEAATLSLVRNICYHELIHAGSHHAKALSADGKVLKSGLKIQIWDIEARQTVLNRGLNEGFTQYLANCYSAAGQAYRQEVAIVGQLIRRIGLMPLRAAYFGPAIEALHDQIQAVFGPNSFERLSALIDQQNYEAALTIVE